MAALMETFLVDLRHAVRTSFRERSFALLAVMTLALGVGINTTVFSVLRAVVLSPLPYDHSQALTIIWSSFHKMGAARAPGSGVELREIQRETRSYQGVAGIWVGTGTLTGTAEPEQLKIGWVTWNFFDVLGVRPALGRSLLANEEGRGARRSVVISDALWHHRFGADPSAIGRVVRLDGQAVTIAGVMPAGFKLYFPADSNVPGEIPAFAAFPYYIEQTPKDLYFIRYLGRLKPGTTMAEAREDLNGIARRLRQQYVEYQAENLTLEPTPLKQDAVREVRPTLLALMTGAGFVLLIACANVANLLLARASARRKEIAVRAAIGASRGRVMQQLLAESAVLAVVATALGTALGWAGTRTVMLMRPESLARLDAFSVDPVVFGFVLAILLASIVLFGMLPVMQVTKLNLLEALREGGRTTRAAGRKGFRTTLVVGEISLGFVLLTGTGLMILSFRHVQDADPGFTPRRVLTFEIGFPDGRYGTDASRNHFATELEERIAALPAVRSVGAVSHLPLDDYPNWYSPYARQGATEQESKNLLADYRAITPGYFSAIGARVLEGRAFSKMDRVDSASVVIVDDLLARSTWHNHRAVGQKITAEHFVNGNFVSKPAEVVGVVAHIQHHSLTNAVRGQIYLPYTQSSREHLSFVVRTKSDPLAIADAIRREVAQMDKNMAVSKMLPMENYVARASAPAGFTAVIASTFGALGLLLAGIGVYSVTSYSMLQRTHEMAVRLAVGAKRTDVIRLVIREGLVLAGCGIGLGLICALLLSEYLRVLLFGVAAVDPLTYAAVGLVLAVATVVACWRPAWQASRQSILATLRLE